MGSGDLTTAAVIRMCESLEDESSTFYRAMAERWTAHQGLLSTFADEGRKNKTHIVRTYQETISDAYEASYSFEGLDVHDFTIDTTLSIGASLSEALQQALRLEQRADAFYRDVAERSESLLATIPGAFRRTARVRSKRCSKLEALLQAAEDSTQ